MRKLCRVLLSLGAAHLMGCGFFASNNVEYGTRVYGGIRYDFEDILPRSLPLSAICTLLDFPFSFLADTLYLPVSMAEALRSNLEPASSLTIIDGFVIEGENPDDPEVIGIPTAPLPTGLIPIPALRSGLSRKQTASRSGLPWEGRRKPMIAVTSPFSSRKLSDGRRFKSNAQPTGRSRSRIETARADRLEVLEVHSLLVRMKKT